jgi:hypothetical protein
MNQHERYIYARWGALPIVWCVAGELNLPYYLSPDFPNKGEKQTAEWEKVLAYARSINCFNRPITSHPTGVGRLSMRGALNDVSLLDFDMIQTPHGQMEAVGPSVEAVRFSHREKPALPTINAEPSYEMLMDKTPAEVCRRIFWVCWASGVKGYTYGANGIWQVNRRDQRYGKSPHGGDYGKIAWDEAMSLAGSTQVGLGKKLLSEFEWWNFEPVENGASWAEGAAGDKYTVPYAFGDERVKMVYVPERRAIVVRQLEVGKKYGGFYFDPVSGEKIKTEQFEADLAGMRRIEAPKMERDWVVVLEKGK